jgi:hypothetical protein
MGPLSVAFEKSLLFKTQECLAFFIYQSPSGILHGSFLGWLLPATIFLSLSRALELE